jgi:hypothetical protein
VGFDDLDRLAPDRAGRAEEGNPFHAASVGMDAPTTVRRPQIANLVPTRLKVRLHACNGQT